MFIYNLLIYILSPIIIIKILYDSLRRGNDSSFIKQRLGLLSFEKNQDTIWLHASSIGETKIALKLLKVFREKNSNDQYTGLLHFQIQRKSGKFKKETQNKETIKQ